MSLLWRLPPPQRLRAVAPTCGHTFFWLFLVPKKTCWPGCMERAVPRERKEAAWAQGGVGLLQAALLSTALRFTLSVKDVFYLEGRAPEGHTHSHLP